MSEPGEECDEGAANSDSAQDGCRTDCRVAHCGDGVADSGELCDGSDLEGSDCQDAGFDSGNVACLSTCDFDASDCSLPWVSIPGGSFSMGSTSGNSNELPVHTVTVPGFEMTRTEVTVKQYGACVAIGSCAAPDPGGQCNWNDPGYEEHPMNCVDWQSAIDFCTWVGGRLPSEAEWEYAARSGGQDITYPWGEAPATCAYAVMADCGTARTMPVCSKPAGDTIQGLCDMAGNVVEWVQDWYHENYTGAPTDGSAWEVPNGLERIERGGSFQDGASDMRAASRGLYPPVHTMEVWGFRCVR